MSGERSLVPRVPSRPRATATHAPAEAGRAVPGRYSPPGSAEAAAKSETDTPTEVVAWLVLSSCLAVWGVVGFILWIPRVVRAAVLFSLSLVQITLGEGTPRAAGLRLRSAAGFYWRGFTSAFDAVRSTRGEDSNDEWSIDLGLLLREAAWAAVIWYSILLALGIAPWTPADLDSALAGSSWSDLETAVTGWWSAISAPVRSWLDGA